MILNILYMGVSLQQQLFFFTSILKQIRPIDPELEYTRKIGYCHVGGHPQEPLLLIWFDFGVK